MFIFVAPVAHVLKGKVVANILCLQTCSTEGARVIGRNEVKKVAASVGKDATVSLNATQSRLGGKTEAPAGHFERKERGWCWQEVNSCHDLLGLLRRRQETCCHRRRPKARFPAPNTSSERLSALQGSTKNSFFYDERWFPLRNTTLRQCIELTGSTMSAQAYESKAFSLVLIFIIEGKCTTSTYHYICFILTKREKKRVVG